MAQARPLIHRGELSSLPSLTLNSFSLPLSSFHFFSSMLAPLHPCPSIASAEFLHTCLVRMVRKAVPQYSAFPLPVYSLSSPRQAFDPCILLSTTVASSLMSPYSELLHQPCLQASHHGNELSLHYTVNRKWLLEGRAQCLYDPTWVFIGGWGAGLVLAS